MNRNSQSSISKSAGSSNGGPSLSQKLLLPEHDTTPRRQYHQILLSSQGAAREHPYPGSLPIWSLELKERLHDHPEAESGMAQVWRCRARPHGREEEERVIHDTGGLDVVLKLYVKSLAEVSEDALPVRPLNIKPPRKDWHRMRWPQGINAIDRYTMVSELMVKEQGRGIEIDYGIYRFVIDGSECEGIVVEDSGKSTTSVAEWLQKESLEETLNYKKLQVVLESAFALLQSFIDHEMTIRFSELRFYETETHSRVPEFERPIMALGYTQVQHKSEPRRRRATRPWGANSVEELLIWLYRESGDNGKVSDWSDQWKEGKRRVDSP